MRHLVSTSFAVLLVLVAVGPIVSAQEQETGEDSLLPAPEISFKGEILVTGSLIPRADLTFLSPVTIMDVPTELTYSGTVRIEDLLTTMPQVFAGQNSTVSNGASGTATIALRNLGPHRTLVLINGRRMALGDTPWAYGADLNTIPAPLVKRVDVLTGGASTVYGSDAMAGVVNFIMDTDFDGVRGGLQYSFYNHDNNNEYVQELNRDAGFDFPTGWTNDGNAINANVALGGKFADGKGHASVYLDYRKIDSLTKASRDYLNCKLDYGSSGPRCEGAGANERGLFVTDRWYTLDWREDGGDGHSFRPFDNDYFNHPQYFHIQRPDEKYNAGAFANYEINKHFDVYMEIMYMNNYTDAQIAPGNTAFEISSVNCDNPMLSAQQYDIICAQQGYEPTDDANVFIGRYNVEGGSRTSQLGHTNIRMIAGLRGDLNDAWSYDFYWLKAQNNSQESYVNALSAERVNRAINVIEDPNTGEWVCRSGSDDGCVPWNVFTEGAVTQEAVDYISTVGVFYGLASTQVVNLTLTSDWENYGIAFPSASEGVQIAVGAEYREEFLESSPDEVFRTGDIANFYAFPEIKGRFNVKEAFLELLVPIVQDARGARDFSLELGYRYSDYSTAGDVNTYKAMASWAITDSWRLRGGYNRAVRAPNIIEIFDPQRLERGGGTEDPCEGEEPGASFEECARTGVTEAQYGNLPESPFGRSNAFWGGNPRLTPEVGDTVTAGLVWTPRSITGLSVTLDYYDIEITEAITEIETYYIQRLCMGTGDPFYCGLIHRNAQGSLWTTTDGYIDATLQNIGALSAEGVDLNANYLIGLGGAGYLATDLMGSYMLENGLQEEIFDFDCAGYFGTTCGQPRPEWQHRFRATWETNFRLSLSLAWRYLGGVEVDWASPDPHLRDPERLDRAIVNGIDTIRAYNWFDLAASYTLRNGIKFTVGVNNILDEEPPLAPGLSNNYGVNLYANYDPLGRYIFSSVQFSF